MPTLLTTSPLLPIPQYLTIESENSAGGCLLIYLHYHSTTETRNVPYPLYISPDQGDRRGAVAQVETRVRRREVRRPGHPQGKQRHRPERLRPRHLSGERRVNHSVSTPLSPLYFDRIG